MNRMVIDRYDEGNIYNVYDKKDMKREVIYIIMCSI